MTDNSTTTANALCADVCLAAGEPLAGTAIEVDVWLMLEYRRAWQAKALNDNALSEATNNWLADTVQRFAEEGLTARPQFIRRPERTSGLQLFVARNGQTEGAVVANETQLRQLDLVAEQLPEVVEPQYFVCTNAKRDLCCAKFGRPTYAALHRAVPGRAWQTTHVGGHRYAPNVLAFPEAALYGRVTVADVPEFLEATEQRQLARKFLRGRTNLSKIAQVADHTIALHTGAEDHQLLRESADGAAFVTANGVMEVQVTAAAQPFEIIPSCGKPAETITPMTGVIL